LFLNSKANNDNLKEIPITIHLVCKDNKAYRELEKLCAKYGNKMYIDWEQSQVSYEFEMKAKEEELHHFSETYKKYKLVEGDN